MAIFEDIKHRLLGLKNKLKRIETSIEKRDREDPYMRTLFGRKESLKEEIMFYEYLIDEYND